MIKSINYYLTEKDDLYRPLEAKASLQQYDNYQIYDMHCIDTEIKTVQNQIPEITTNQMINLLAVQAYSPYNILCDFNQIVDRYP